MTGIRIEPSSEICSQLITLLNTVLGPGRFARTAYRIRELSSPDNCFALNAYQDTQLVGTVHVTAIKIGGKEGACLIGPLIVAEQARGQKLGEQLLDEAIELASTKGQVLALLVGDLVYYQRAGFQLAPNTILLPGPVQQQRLLVREIEDCVLTQFEGVVAAI